MLGLLGLTVLMCQNIWLLQDYSERTRPVDIKVNELIIKESQSTRDYINYAADYNKAKVILSETTPSLNKSFQSLFKTVNTPESALSDENHPGNCWAFYGDRGHITIQLAESIYPMHFSLVHATLAEYHTAPSHFCIFSINKGQNLLGCYDFDLGAKMNVFKQTFKCISNCEIPSKKYRLVIDSNYGSERTCLYQLQIHGEPLDLTL